MKTKIGNIINALDKIKQLNGFYYTANDLAKSYGYQGEIQVGVSAQETQKVLPMIVVPAPVDDKFLTVKYEKIIPLIIEALKEINDNYDNLKQDFEKFKSTIK